MYMTTSAYLEAIINKVYSSFELTIRANRVIAFPSSGTIFLHCVEIRSRKYVQLVHPNVARQMSICTLKRILYRETVLSGCPFAIFTS